MNATTHQIEHLPGPQDTSWVDDVLAALGSPAGVLVGRPLGVGAGTVVTLREDGAELATPSSAGAVRLGPARPYAVDFRRAGTSAGPARYLQLVTFDGPRDADWSAAYDRAGDERLWPATRDVPGIVEVLGARAADGGRLTAILAESVEALEAAAVAIMSTPLLPGEDPAYLTGPDALVVLRLLHADLPAGVSRAAVAR